MDNISSNKTHDEIDLFDLILILLKYRKFIFIFNLLVFLLCFGGFFVYSSVKYKSIPNQEVSKTICRVMQSPLSKSNYNNFELISLFKSTPTVLEAMKLSGIEKVGSIDIVGEDNRLDALSWLENNFPLDIIDQNNELERKKYQTDPTYQIIKITYINSNSVQAELFLLKMFELVNEKIMLIDNESDISLILFDQPYSILDKTKLSLGKIKSNYIKRALIVVFISVLFSFIIAYFYEFIISIKEDRSKCIKIKSTLNKD